LFIFAAQSEAIHNKDYSVVKTLKAAPKGSLFFQGLKVGTFSLGKSFLEIKSPFPHFTTCLETG
jgi:hypothetical protein